MIRCCLRRLTVPWVQACPNFTQKLAFSACSTQYATNTETFSKSFPVFRKIEEPAAHEKDNPDLWVSLLEPGLPPHLREGESDISSDPLNARDLAEILLAAQRSVNSSKGVDVLSHLGLRQGRWRAVIWLIKHVIENIPNSSPDLQSYEQPRWVSQESLTLEELTGSGPIHVASNPSESDSQAVSSSKTYTLEKMTEQTGASHPGSEKNLRFAILNQIWCSLGKMTLSCTDAVIKPEILEIIAYLHHQGIMPLSIYNQKPQKDETAIQQPPTLHLLSSRILTSLSDAAWRAHEKLVIEETKAKGASQNSIRPEVRGSVYRVNVAGLRVEVWIELILWSCLNGGWILAGANILEELCARVAPQQWTALSWRSLTSVQLDPAEWDELAFLFQTKSPSTVAAAKSTQVDIGRTISSEVVHAYIDALLTLSASRGETCQISLSQLAQYLTTLREFLERSGLQFGGGSWDAILLRALEYNGDSALAQKSFWQLYRLSPTFGSQITPETLQTLPSYVLDGSAAAIGLAHRALMQHIKAGNIREALNVLRDSRKYTDANMRKSLAEFFLSMRSAKDSKYGHNGQFSSTYPRIEFPAFELQIPPTILGLLLDLVTDAKAYDVGKWLLFSEDLDGPLIPETMYSHPAVAPALINFATSTNDCGLINQVVRSQVNRNLAFSEGPKVENTVLRSFLDHYLLLRRWDSAERILEHLRNSTTTSWNIANLAHLAGVMLDLRSELLAGRSGCEIDFDRAKALFGSMTKARSQPSTRRDIPELHIFIAAFASIDIYWTEYCSQLLNFRKHYKFELSAKVFNILLEGVVKNYGSTAGRLLLDKFWPPAVRRAQYRQRYGGSGETFARAERASSWLNAPARQRTIVRLPGHEDRQIIIYGGLQPNVFIINTVFRKALEELRQTEKKGNGEKQTRKLGETMPTDANILASKEIGGAVVNTSIQETIMWAIQCFRTLGLEEGEVNEELTESLSEFGLNTIISQLPWLLRNAKEENVTIHEQ